MATHAAPRLQPLHGVPFSGAGGGRLPQGLLSQSHQPRVAFRSPLPPRTSLPPPAPHPHHPPTHPRSAVVSRYLDLFDAAGKLCTLRDAEFIAMLQFLGRTGLVRRACCGTSGWHIPTCCWGGVVAHP